MSHHHLVEIVEIGIDADTDEIVMTFDGRPFSLPARHAAAVARAVADASRHVLTEHE